MEDLDGYLVTKRMPLAGAFSYLFGPRINLRRANILPVICGSEKCSAQFFIRDEEIVARKPN